MPASLWLAPPSGSPVESALQKLISDTLPPYFAPAEKVPHFVPHLTLTSRLPEEFDNPQAVLDQIEVNELPEVIFKEVNVGDFFFTRITLHTEKTPPLINLAKQCRLKLSEGTANKSEAAAWAEKVFTPHVSLVYSNMASEKVKTEILQKAAKDIHAAGIVVGAGGVPGLAVSGWKGGRILLVETWKDISEWKVIAERVL